MQFFCQAAPKLRDAAFLSNEPKQLRTFVYAPAWAHLSSLASLG